METSQALPGAPGQPSSHLELMTGPRRHLDASHPPSCRSQPLLTGPHTGTPLRAHEADLSSLSGWRGKTPRRRVACAPRSSPQAPARKGWCLPSLSGIFRSRVRVKTEQEGSLPGTSVPSLPKPKSDHLSTISCSKCHTLKHYRQRISNMEELREALLVFFFFFFTFSFNRVLDDAVTFPLHASK